MIPVRFALPFLLLAVTLGCRSSETPPPSHSGIELLKAPAQGLHVEADMRVSDLLERYTSLMGWTLEASDGVRSMLADAVCSLEKPIDMPPSGVHSFVESILRSRGFVLSFAHTEAPVVVGIGSLELEKSLPKPELAPLVEADEFARWATHPCFLIQTRVSFPGVDSSAVPDRMRALLPTFPPQPIVALGGEQLLLRGYGADLAQLAPAFRALADKSTVPSVTSSAPVGDPRLLQLLERPAKPLHLEKPAKEDFKLRHLVNAYTQLMGWQAVFGPDTANQLRVLRCDLALPLDVPPENVHAFVESVLKANDMILSFAYTQEPVLLRIESTNVPGKSSPREHAALVPATDLPRWAAHPDFLVTSCLDLPGVDVRALSNSLRQTFSDAQTGQIIPVGNTSGLIVTGFGSEVMAVAGMMHALAESAAGKPIAMPAPPTEKSVADLLVTPAQPLRLEMAAVQEFRLFHLVEAYAKLMGWRVLIGPDTANQLKTLRWSLELPMEISPDSVHSFVEGVLRANDFVLHFAHTQDPVLLEITSTNVAGRGNPRKDAVGIPEAELPRWASHPAFLVSTCIDLPGIDVRTLSNSLRQMFSDQQTQQIIPIGNTDDLIVTGFGSDVVDITRMLRSLQATASGARPALPSFAGRTTGIDLLVPPQRSLHIEKSAKGRFTLLELLQRYTELLGWRMLAGPDTRNQLHTLDAGIGLPLEVPAENVHAFVESILRANDFVFGFAHQCEPIVLTVASGSGPRARAGGGEPKFVPVSELPRWAGHPAFLVETCIDLDGVDVRTLVNTLRPKFNDQQTQRIIPVGNSNTVLISGFAPDVIDSLSWICDLGRGAPALKPPVLPPPAAPDRERLFPEGKESLTLDAAAERDGDPFVALETFGKWSNRSVQISDAARAALQRLERKRLEQHIWSAPLVYSYVSLLLQRAGCTLLPVPPAAPIVWAVDVQQPAPEHAPETWPEIPIEELTSWGAYCATPFRAQLHLENVSEANRLVRALQLLDVTRSRGEMLNKSEVVLWGTPQEIQTAAGIVRAACEPAPSPR